MEPIILPRNSNQKPLVSVISKAYNHEPYIRDCLEGFLMQKTTFPVEYIIHDDASTDHTADIIREYYEKRPDLFHVIIERENQYSQHKVITHPLFLMAQGKYIALCEGDDYWTDPLKLQKQSDFMETHPDYSLCCHNAIIWNMKNNNQHPFYEDYPECDFSIEYILTNRDGLIRTGSMFFRSELVTVLLKYREKCHVGDLPLAICMAKNGKIHFHKEIMSIYRICSKGSWTEKSTDISHQYYDINSRVKWFDHIRTLVGCDNAIDTRISRDILFVNMYEANYKSFKNRYSLILYKRLPMFGRFLFICFYVVIFIYSFIRLPLLFKVSKRLNSKIKEYDRMTQTSFKASQASEYPLAIPKYCE